MSTTRRRHAASPAHIHHGALQHKHGAAGPGRAGRGAGAQVIKAAHRGDSANVVVIAAHGYSQLQRSGDSQLQRSHCVANFLDMNKVSDRRRSDVMKGECGAEEEVGR
ncbi:hypothetical protein EVAR_70093_1 [Eumeta japonica]|uniref:Uncharacterized protein n=1 Tax=Eumeta variegata TaxID=151549 RepID=A0A4C2A1A4_EUMVA|nr:hypothetical protein EVAR_70093_1 [Eumeta japonica]